jgi:hypothetical protein
MILIIKKISATTRIPQIEQFLSPVLKGGFLKRKGVIDGLEIKMFKHPDLNVPEYHAIIKVEPDVVANRVIQRLNRKVCDGKPVNISQYHVRYRTNDRRDGLHTIQHDRRMSDRRRKNIDITDVTRLKAGERISQSLLGDGVQLSANPFDNTFKI